MKYLAIGGGAMGYYSILGKLAQLKDQGRLTDIEAMAGASCGSLIVFMYALCKGDIKEILKKSMELDIHKCTKPNLISILTRYGLIKPKLLKKELKKFAYECMKTRNPTFEQLSEHVGLDIYIPAFCLTTGKTDYFSNITQPNMKVLDAVGASISVPLLFTSQTINDKIYIDGAIQEKLPLTPFLHKSWKEIEAIEIISPEQNIKITDMKTFIERLTRSTLEARVEYQGIKTLKLEIPHDVIFNFDMNPLQKLELYVKGYTT